MKMYVLILVQLMTLSGCSNLDDLKQRRAEEKKQTASEDVKSEIRKKCGIPAEKETYNRPKQPSRSISW